MCRKMIILRFVRLCGVMNWVIIFFDFFGNQIMNTHATTQSYTIQSKANNYPYWLWIVCSRSVSDKYSRIPKRSGWINKWTNKSSVQMILNVFYPRLYFAFGISHELKQNTIHFAFLLLLFFPSSFLSFI